MSAHDVFAQAQHQGVHIKVQGSNLTLHARRRPSDTLLHALRQHKTELLTILAKRVPPLKASSLPDPHGRPPTEAWTDDDWQGYFGERAGIAEYDGGLERLHAEFCAFEDCLDHWLAMHPPPTEPGGLCLHCRLSISPSELEHIQTTGVGGPVGPLHPNCAPKWMVSRRLEARRTLAWLLGLEAELSPWALESAQAS